MVGGAFQRESAIIVYRGVVFDFIQDGGEGQSVMGVRINPSRHYLLLGRCRWPCQTMGLYQSDEGATS